MKKKSQKMPRISTIQYCEMVPITDPAEQAKIDRLFREADKPTNGKRPHSNRTTKPRKSK